MRLRPAGEDSVALTCAGLSFPPEEVIFAAEVFAELGLLRFENGKPALAKNKKSDLSLSALYNAVCALKQR